MDRISAAGGSPTCVLANGQLGRQDENLATGTEGTTDPSLYSNALQEEAMGIIEFAALTPDIDNWTQLLQALQIMFGGSFHAFSDAGAFSFTIPAGVTGYKYMIVGAGGGGGDGNGAAGAGGSSGGISMGYFAVTPGSEIAGIIGAGGAPGASGGSTSFGYLWASGGAGGGEGVPGNSALAGDPGSGQSGNLLLPGTRGAIGNASLATWVAGRGGAGPFGGGGPEIFGSAAGPGDGVSAVSPGAGGGGAIGSADGGTGANGLVLLWS
jgi:hypothetical protein